MPEINGVTIFELPHRQIDERGAFTKILSLNITPRLTIEEVLLSKTKLGVVRGMHFQNGPFLNNRIISCVEVKVFAATSNPEASTGIELFDLKNYKEVYDFLLEKTKHNPVK